jgi:hypothetical protein
MSVSVRSRIQAFLFLFPLNFFANFSSLFQLNVEHFYHSSLDYCEYLLLNISLYSSRLSTSPRHLRRLVADFPPRRARVRAHVRSCGICCGQSGTGAGFLPVLRFPLPILIPPTAPHSSSIIRAWYNKPVSGRRTKWAQSHRTPRN